MNAKLESNIEFMEIVDILNEVTNEDEILINYAEIYYAAMKLLRVLLDESEYTLPIPVEKIFQLLNAEVRMERLNDYENKIEQALVNRVLGKISVRPDYFEKKKQKITVYADKEQKKTLVNYVLAHELCHLILYLYPEKEKEDKFYVDTYFTMPMLPKNKVELVADAFAIFLLIPFDKFIDIFFEYVNNAKERGAVPISTEEWIDYLSVATGVPYYYVAGGYEQIRHVASLIYSIHIADEKKREEYQGEYGEKVMKLYEMVKDKLTNEIVSVLYQ